MSADPAAGLPGWSDLTHGGLLLDAQRQAEVAALAEPRELGPWLESEARRRADLLRDPDRADAERSGFVAFVLERLYGFHPGEADRAGEAGQAGAASASDPDSTGAGHEPPEPDESASTGQWLRGGSVPAEYRRLALTGESVRPRHLWLGPRGAVLPVFVTADARLGIGRGRRETSRVLGWLRGGSERLALLTNGRQWRLLFAGLDFDAWCQWDADLWFAEGAPTPALRALLALIQPPLWTPAEEGADPPLLQAVRNSRKGQSELSESLGERVREAVELLIRSHGEALKRDCEAVDPADIYRAACRVVMRLVVVLFAEARGLLPRDDAVYNESYGLGGLHEALRRRAAAGRSQARSFGAWPRLLALFDLVRKGSHHQALPVPAYGGDLFAPGSPDAGDDSPGAAGPLGADSGQPASRTSRIASEDGLSRALACFETACLRDELLSDAEVHDLLERLTRTQVRIRQGRASRLVSAPVDFSDLSTEYIGVLYEGLLDYELKTASGDDSVIFLAVGEQPALPLKRLEAMDDKALRSLFAAMKKTPGSTESPPTDPAPPLGAPASPPAPSAMPRSGEPEPQQTTPTEDPRQATRTRAETWARRAALAAGLVKKPRRRAKSQTTLPSPHEEQLSKRAASLVSRVVLPGEWYLVRWGGTRKGSGSFYTRPGLTVPTVQRTLRPLAYDPPRNADGEPDRDATPSRWTPKPPEDILSLKVCDPACGSGSFPLAALRFLTDALYASVRHHRRVEEQGDRSLVRLLGLADAPTADAPTAYAPTVGAPAFRPASSAMSRSDEPEPPPNAAATENPGDELIPCPPTASDFEPRLRAVLRRYVVERCIYGVDLDPLAVSLCQLSLWIETMDRDLPFSFLDHKIRCGNSLVGAWFDQFRHYPAMAWKNREAGDRTHSNGVHHRKGERTKAIKAWVKNELTPNLRHTLEGPTLFHEDLLEQASAAHGQAQRRLERMHRLPVRDAAERARLYREELLGSAEWRSLKQAMDLWCACWFWPADELDRAPLPTTFADPPAETRAAAARVAAEMRFFHWELEFPDVFREEGSGFDAMLGNPPWDIAKPKSQEFFSSIDPLYRSYGKQEAVRRQSACFAEDPQTERDWLAYNARFRAQSNFVTCAASPFGDPEENDKSQRRFAVARGKANLALHDRWRDARRRSRGYADAEHPFRRQGSADLNLYKLFLEQAHALLREGGRLGFVVPSGLYSDQGAGALRDLFLERCAWEWLFGFENRAKLFPIHRSYKFNPVIIRKGGATEAIRTVFMRRDLTDWERGEEIAVPYSLEQVRRFSPKSRAILEIESRRDLEVLEKIYENSVLLGDDGPDGWGIRYAREFDMTNDSKLFPPRPVWEAKGYRPDEYSRWLLGNWRPMEELWAELGVDPGRVVPAGVELEDWLFDPDASPERRRAERQFVHGHLLAPGDVDATGWEVRCAQPPYDRLPVPRVAIPEGIILSREADAWIDEKAIKDVALPLYEGRMIGQFDFSQKGWVSGKGRGAVWREIPWERKQIEPQYLMAEADYRQGMPEPDAPKLAHMDITSGTNERTAIGTYSRGAPFGNSAPVLYGFDAEAVLILSCLFGSFAFDYVTRSRLTGLHLNYHVLEQIPVPSPSPENEALQALGVSLMLAGPNHSPSLLRLTDDESRHSPREPSQALTDHGLEPRRAVPAHGPSALTQHERVRLKAIADAVVATLYGLDSADFRSLLADCDHPVSTTGTRKTSDLRGKGFWRVDKDQPPELRHTVLAQIAFSDLQTHIEAAAGDREAGIRAFLSQNHGDGWRLPETLRLADHNLGHDDRASEHQPVATELGPRFYDWQLVQPAEEARRETHLHARNLLGEHAYHRLLATADRRQADCPETHSFPDSQVAESRHQWHDWLGPKHADDDPEPSEARKIDQTDLFD